MLSKQKNVIKAVSKRCLNFSKSKPLTNGKQWFKEHLLLCKGKPEAQIKLPSKNKANIEFCSTTYQYPSPIVIYADFEVSMLPVAAVDEDITKRTNYQNHEPNSYCLLLKVIFI